jgi:outer membrane lipoprotein carrier protein
MLRSIVAVGAMCACSFGPYGSSCASAVAFSAPATAVPPSAQAFAAIIDHHYDSLHSLSVSFTQEYAGMGIERTESGTLLLKRPGKMRWTYSKPTGKLFILDGHYAYFYTPGQDEIPRVAANKLDDLRSPLAFLLGHAELAKQLTGLKLERVGLSPGTWMLTGVPRGMEKRVSAMTIAARDDGTITMLRVEETDGAINTFRLSNEQADAPTPASAFQFTPPPGTHVIDGMPPM